MEQNNQNIEQLNNFSSLENLRLRLLDLTSRNRLINFNHTKTGSLRVIDELPNQLVESLLSDVEMRFLAIPEPTESELISAGYIEYSGSTREVIRLRKDPSAEEWAKRLGFAISYEVPEPSKDDDSSKHSDNAIQTLLYPYEMEAKLKDMLQSSESAIQEMGANILYIAFGFLEWFDTNAAENSRIAPLFLVPVRLHKGSLNKVTKTYEYTLSYSGEGIIPNLSLKEKLRADFSMFLPDIDESTVPEDYFREVHELIKLNQPRWRVRRYITLTLLNFSKLLMYLDLDPARWPKNASIEEHPIVKRFLIGQEKDADRDGESLGDLGFGEEYFIDEFPDIHQKYPLIDDADSSQHSALIDAIDGKNLVIEGPPGTGKSQTITNLIAAAMAQGKRVLFVAEKLAALEVVRSRLDAVGLGEFCLELHSHKSQKRKVLDEIKERLNKHNRYRKPQEIEVEIERFEELKSALNAHALKINKKWKGTGKSLHEIFMAATRHRNSIGVNPELLHPSGYNGDNYTAAVQHRHKGQVDTYRNVYQAVTAQISGITDLQEHPWCGVKNDELQLFDLENVKSLLDAWQVALVTLNNQRKKIADTILCEEVDVAFTSSGIAIFLAELNKIPSLHGDEILELIPDLNGTTLENSKSYLQLFENIQDHFASLSNKVGHEVLKDLTTVDQLIVGSHQLKRLVSQKATLADVAHLFKRLEKLIHKLEQLNTPLQGVISELGESASNHMTVSETGLIEFKTAIELISNLNPTYWKLRNELFDNEEVDELLPLLRNDLDELNELHVLLDGSFSLDSLPSNIEILRLKSTLETGGLFRWLKGSWRAARREVRNLAANERITLTTQIALLVELSNFSKNRFKLENNARYQEVFGNFIQGLDTNVHALESLRQWYKQIRQQYGMSFGHKVSIGNSILKLDPNVARAIRSLAEQGVPTQINQILDEIKLLKEICEPVGELRNENSILIGETAVLPHLQSELKDAIVACDSFVQDKSLSIADLIDRIDQLSHLKHKVENWQGADINRIVFHGQLSLSPGLGKDNIAGLSKLRNTLEVASCVNAQLNNEHLVNYIYQYPEVSTFNSLAVLTQQVQVASSLEASAYEAFRNLVHLDHVGWFAQSGQNIENLISRNQSALVNSETLQNWLDYVRARNQLGALGLNRLAECVEKKLIDIAMVDNAYQAGIFDLLSREILKADPELGRFSGHAQESLQVQFKDYDTSLKKLHCEHIAWKIDQNKVPVGNVGVRASERSERTLLEHECSKQARHIPIRQLLRRSANALVALKPCFMMGPMSVSQYLAPGMISFDLVVMDEASQIKPQDALGAVARGGQLVVVGDPKQLPPTSFFDRVVEDDDEEDPTGIEESESILDAALTMFKARRLRWHYRSQHESLIAFSNQSFYENDLVIFPSPHKQTDSYGIQYSRVPRGCFVNRRNMEEAKIISDAVREHFKHRPEETLGVVAMNAEQRLQIERAIETLAKDDPLFQGWLDRDATRRESLFIKNLENVQGDERDVIFVSMTYGPQEPGGKTFQRFGPINSEVGWRRLNVLFTRSKKRMHIFSSMGSDDIAIGSNSKRGVHALRDFLSFCETGILHQTIEMTGRPPDSDFEISVMDALRNEGFECIPQVGVAGFFIDVAVVDPGNPSHYLMGIECDGATYHSAKSARDRDRLRQAILERLGWNIRRIWSTDWFKNPKGELQPIIQELHKLKSAVVTTDVPFESEFNEIVKIIDEVDTREAQSDEYAFEEMTLKDKLIRFDREVIRKNFPSTEENKRLLRPSMLEALLEYMPTSKVEFLQTIPAYIRQATEAAEGKYLEQVFDIINVSFEKA